MLKIDKHIEQVFKSVDILAQKQILRDTETLEDMKVAIKQLTSISEEKERPAAFIHPWTRRN